MELGTLAEWVSGLGSLSAVVVALYLARSKDRIKLKIHIGHRLMVTSGPIGGSQEFVQIGATNIGSRVAHINNIGYRVGMLRKQHAVQHVDHNAWSSTIPIDLSDGENARWNISLERENNWIEKFAKDFLLPNWKFRLWSARLQIFTTVGKTFEAPFEKNIKQKLAKECRRLEKVANK